MKLPSCLRCNQPIKTLREKYTAQGWLHSGECEQPLDSIEMRAEKRKRLIGRVRTAVP